MTQPYTEEQKQATLDDLRSVIAKSVRQDGLEGSLIELGISAFQAEAVIHELLCVVLSNQRLLIEKGIYTAEEFATTLAETSKEQDAILDSSYEKLVDEENK